MLSLGLSLNSKILGYLSNPDIASFFSTCKQLHRVSQEDSFWMNRVLGLSSYLTVDLYRKYKGDRTWKEYFTEDFGSPTPIKKYFDHSQSNNPCHERADFAAVWMENAFPDGLPLDKKGLPLKELYDEDDDQFALPMFVPPLPRQERYMLQFSNILHTSIRRDRLDTINIFLSKNVNPALVYGMAIEYSAFKIIKHLITEYGMDVNIDNGILMKLTFDFPSSTSNDVGQDVQLIKFLIDSGYNVKPEDFVLLVDGMWLCLDSVKLIVENCDIDVRDYPNRVRQAIGCCNGTDLLKYFVSKGFDLVNDRTLHKKLLDRASGEVEKIDYLVSLGVQFEEIDLDEALVTACRSGSVECLKILHDMGASIFYGEDIPLRIALLHCRPNIAKYLLEHGACLKTDIHQLFLDCTMSGDMVKFLKVNNYIETVEIMVSMGADFHMEHDIIFNYLLAEKIFNILIPLLDRLKDPRVDQVRIFACRINNMTLAELDKWISSINDF